MKRLAVILLCLVMCFAFVACGKGNTTNNNFQNNSAITSEQTVNLFAQGVVNGNTWENKFCGLGCRLDSSWSFYDDAKIQELNQQALGYMPSDVADLVENANLIYDMYATTGNGKGNINVIFEKLNPAYANYPISQILTSQVPALKQNLENMGFKVVNSYTDKVTIEGKSYDAIFVESTLGNLNFHQTGFAFKCGDYMVTISIGAYTNVASLEDIIGCFYHLG